MRLNSSYNIKMDYFADFLKWPMIISRPRRYSQIQNGFVIIILMQKLLQLFIKMSFNFLLKQNQKVVSFNFQWNPSQSKLIQFNDSKQKNNPQKLAPTSSC